MLNVTSMITTKKTATEYTRIIPTKKTSQLNKENSNEGNEGLKKKAVKHIETNEQSDRSPS